jgi:hypothetical protein
MGFAHLYTWSAEFLSSDSEFIFFFLKVIIHIITYPAVPLDITDKENIKLQIQKLSKWRSL